MDICDLKHNDLTLEDNSEHELYFYMLPTEHAHNGAVIATTLDTAVEVLDDLQIRYRIRRMDFSEIYYVIFNKEEDKILANLMLSSKGIETFKTIKNVSSYNKSKFDILD